MDFFITPNDENVNLIMKISFVNLLEGCGKMVILYLIDLIINLFFYTE